MEHMVRGYVLACYAVNCDGTLSSACSFLILLVIITNNDIFWDVMLFSCYKFVVVSAEHTVSFFKVFFKSSTQQLRFHLCYEFKEIYSLVSSWAFILRIPHYHIIMFTPFRTSDTP